MQATDIAERYRNDRIRRKLIENNIGSTDRMLSGIAGAVLVGCGIVSRKSAAGALMTAAGSLLIVRGLTGRSPLYRALGISTAPRATGPAASVAHGRGIKIDESVIVNRGREELYQFWRNLQNLPRFMSHLESVRILDPKRSHWVAKAPAGMSVEWDAELYTENRPELLSWRSLQGSGINHAGSVQFRPAADSRATEIRVELNYEPPAGRIGAAVAKLLGEEPGKQIREDLRHLKQLIEAP